MSVFAGVVLVAALFVGLGYVIREGEKREWNNGACQCGKGFFQSFDVDSGGAVGYKCTHCGKALWLSWFEPKRYK